MLQERFSKKIKFLTGALLSPCGAVRFFFTATATVCRRFFFVQVLVGPRTGCMFVSISRRRRHVKNTLRSGNRVWIGVLEHSKLRHWYARDGIVNRRLANATGCARNKPSIGVTCFLIGLYDARLVLKDRSRDFL
jgi:hypothetical protein